MDWASKDQIVDFVMILAHYMDSRFRNTERIQYVDRALKSLVESDRKTDEALLRIDTLSWTLVEADRLTEALDEIVKGLDMAERHATGEDKADLIALGLAWKARVMIEIGESSLEEINELVSKAKNVRCRPWIMHRVSMAAGDVAMKQSRFAEAHEQYSRCAELVKSYGGEGHDYQILPRLGFACLALGQFEAAKAHFEQLAEFEQITVGHMYASYGLALLAQAKGELATARNLIEDLRAQILSRGGSSLLLKLIDKVFEPLRRTALGNP